jgi:hypothetical protein
MKPTNCLLLFLLAACSFRAQDQPVYWDTLKYQKFRSSFIVGIFQAYRNFNNDFQQYKVPDSLGISKPAWHAESRLISGIDISYDKFSLALGLRSEPPKQSTGKGNTRTFNTNLNFGGNIWYIQNSFRYFKGFYDNNTPTYDTALSHKGIYQQQPNMENILYRTKFLYFTHHKKYAFRSGYAGNYRQIRSAATWILSANINYYNLHSDSSFFPLPARAYYGDYASMQGLRVFGLAINGGAAGTLVILKGFFINGMFILGPEQQWRKYSYKDKSTVLSYISLSGDARFSIGLNLKRCYFMFTNTNDFAIYNSSFVGLTNKSLTGGFTFGWRFNSNETPEFYKRFQKTKFYNSI